MNLQQEVSNLFIRQIKGWETAKQNYNALKTIRTRELAIGGVNAAIQFNPARIQSTSATVSAATIQKRPCFLCPENRPEEQEHISYAGKYLILVNPYPVFPRHLTIPCITHTPQQIKGRLGDMLNLAYELPDYILFYNGPRCGASAPDHMHFQAGNKDFLPLEKDWENIKKAQGKIIIQNTSLTVHYLAQYPQTVLVAEAVKKEDIIKFFDHFTSLSPADKASDEIMVNLLCLFNKGIWRLYIMPRKAHRPSQYYAEGKLQKMISPGAVDLGGVIITPRECDFNALTIETAEDIFRQVSITPDETARICNQLINK